MKYILAILNSKISNFIHHLIATPIQGGYSFSKTYMEQIPIKYPNDNEIILFNKLVEIVLKDNNKFIKEIDGFLNWLQNEYKINKLSQKLEKYYELTFEEFLEEIRKKKVDTKKRAIRENLEEEFNNSLKIIKPLQTEIQEIENEINQKVYELYELTDEKIRIIEENI